MTTPPDRDLCDLAGEPLRCPACRRILRWSWRWPQEWQGQGLEHLIVIRCLCAEPVFVPGELLNL